jgi:hypothetical protein
MCARACVFICVCVFEWVNPCVRDKAAIVGVAAVAYALQFVASLLQPSPDYFWMTDSPAYWANATEFARTGRIAEPFFPMGASLFLSPFVAMGVEPYSVVLWVHPAVHAVSAVAAFLIVRSALAAIPAAAAGLMVASYPPLLNYSRQLISEPWFVATLMVGLWLAIRPGRERALLSGVLFGTATLVRTPGLGIVALMPVSLLLLKRAKTDAAAFVVGASAVIITGVMIASASAGRPVFLTSGVSMTTGCRSIYGGYEFLAVHDQPASYLSHLIQSPGLFAQERLFALLNIISPWPLGEGRGLATKLLIFLSDAPVLFFTIASIGLSRRSRRVDDVLLLLVPAIGLISFYTLLFAINRYRMPYIPPLICYGVWVWWPRFFPVRSRCASPKSVVTSGL